MSDGQMDNQITAILTSCGGKASPGVIECLQQVDAYDFEIIGTDINKNAVGKQFVDSFYTVPYGTDSEYPEHMLQLAREVGADVIVPRSDEEVLSLSRSRSEFTDQDISVICSEYDAVEQSSDKGSMLRYLDDRGVPVPEYHYPQSIDEFRGAVYELGYPDTDVVVKPTEARGGRGFWIISEQETPNWILKSRNLQRLPLETLCSLLSEEDGFPSVVVMQYLQGADFNVDTLVDSGTPTYTIPIKRIEPDAGPVRVGRTVHDQAVREMTEKIVQAFGFDYNINVEVAYPTEENTGTPLVYEINPRVSGPIAVHSKAGVNLLLYGILQSIGEDFPRKKSYNEVTVSRCWREVYE